ncbi:MAG: hypothetical protein ACLU99_08330 [Alphaproteobacteria bacterium]
MPRKCKPFRLTKSSLWKHRRDVFAFAGYGVITNAAGDVKIRSGLSPGAFFDYSYRYWLVSCSGFCRFALYSGQGTYGERGYVAVAVAANRLMGDWGVLL